MTKIPGPGHNGGPGLAPGRAWRTHCWRKARAELIGARMPMEVVRRRVARARALGLAYPQYASILLGAGRDITGFLFTCEAMGLRLARRLEMPVTVQEKLAALERCHRLAFAPEGEAPEAFRAELEEVSRVVFAGCGAPPGTAVGWGGARAALKAWLDPSGVPRKGIVLVGTRPAEAVWADAADLARFLPAEAYFAGGDVRRTGLGG